MSDMNRMYNATNPYQGAHKRVLCVCSAGLLRSPTAALVLSQEPFNYNTRAAGVESYALIPVDEVLVIWAHEIVCMTTEHRDILIAKFGAEKLPEVVVLNIPDDFFYRDAGLIRYITDKYKASLHE